MRLTLRVCSEVTHKDKVNYWSVAVTGDVLVHNYLSSLVKVAYVDFEHYESQGNPVVTYLQRHDSPGSTPIPLTTEYHLTSDSKPSLYCTPSTNEPYSTVSGGFNPIHTNPYFAAFASLPDTFTHGMFTSAATRRYVETVIAKGVPDCVFK
jgi:fatty acid synthase subunit alpha, fungi type